MKTLLLCFLAPLLAHPGGASRQEPGSEQALEIFRAAGIELDLEGRRASIPVTVVVRNELLEFLLVAPHGAVHEAMFQTEVDIELLNAALLALGVQPGKDADWKPKDPPPTEEELAEGVRPYEVVMPEGDTFYLYVGWQAEGETFLFRIEDLLRNLESQRAMQRHPWVYLGSRMVEARGGEVFAAAAEGNLVNVTFFKGGSNSLMTASVEDCAIQTIWLPNAWLLPESGSEVRLFFTRERMGQVDATLSELLPTVVEEAEESR